MAKAARVVVVLVATGVLGCGLLIVGGVGPSSAGAELGDSVPSVAGGGDDPYGSTTTTTSETGSPPTPPSTTSSPTTTSATTTTTTTTPIVTTTTTITTAPTTTTSPTIPNVAPSPVPLSVSPDTVWVGPGGTARITGTCPAANGATAGPVEIWEVGTGVTVVATGMQSAAWTFDWTAPATAIEPLTLQAWCGSPAGYTGGFPAELQVEVVFVAQAGPPATSDSGATVTGGDVPRSGADDIPETA